MQGKKTPQPFSIKSLLAPHVDLLKTTYNPTGGATTP